MDEARLAEVWPEQWDRPREWFALDTARVTFGASLPIDTALEGTEETARNWLIGGGVDRLIEAARPRGAVLRPVKSLPGEGAGRGLGDGEGLRQYELQLPALELFGLGKALVRVVIWGAVHPGGGLPSAQGGGGEQRGPLLEIGSDGSPRAVLLAAGQELPLINFDLKVRGAVAVGPRGDGLQGVSAARGWISLTVVGDIPRLGFFEAPEGVLRAAANQVCAQTVGFVGRKLDRDLRKDFESWQAANPPPSPQPRNGKNRRR